MMTETITNVSPATVDGIRILYGDFIGTLKPPYPQPHLPSHVALR